jgi:hypothetical protein
VRQVPHEELKHPRCLWGGHSLPPCRRYIDFMLGINAAELAVLLGILVASALGLFLIVKLAVRQGSK